MRHDVHSYTRATEAAEAAPGRRNRLIRGETKMNRKRLVFIIAVLLCFYALVACQPQQGYDPPMAGSCRAPRLRQFKACIIDSAAAWQPVRSVPARLIAA